MPSELTAKVAVENTAYSFDKLFDYLIPPFLAEKAKPGCRVLVGFGAGDSKRQGVIFDVTDEPVDEKIKLKNIIDVLDDRPVLNNELIELVKWYSDKTFCTYFDAVRAAIPSGLMLNVVETYRCACREDNALELTDTQKQIVGYLKAKNKYVASDKIFKDLGLVYDIKILRNLCDRGYLRRNLDAKRKVSDATVRIVSLSDEYLCGEDNIDLTKKQKSVVDLLKNIGSASSREVAYYTGVTQAVLETLQKKGIIVYSDAEVYRTPEKMRSTPRDTSPIVLSPSQQKAYDELCGLRDSEKAEAALLYGVTGSGKTKVYMKLIDDVAKSGGGVIVMVPEISLTPQVLNMFYARYGERVAVLHSALSLGERLDEWKRIKNGEADIVVGTRSASFAPVEHLRMIIMDEEQEGTYKSEMTPRYHARDIARFRCAYNNALMLLASATPSVESYTKALAGTYHLVELTERYSKSGLPSVRVVDTSRRENMGGFQTVSTVLADELKVNYENGKQSILLINRRGYNTFISCSGCKRVMTCPNCSISLTYHSANNRMMCHYCGHSEPVRNVCPDCGSETIRFAGFGTQKVEQEILDIIPDARVLRMDADTVSGKNSHENKFSGFAKGDYDIMIGTQMVAKGLDFPNVTLVGVISVDQQLYNDDYKSTERTFDLLTQVVGRSGRGEDSGRAVIQTMAPENSVITLAAEQDYKSFYDSEIMIRRSMRYPPYCSLCVIGFSGYGELTVRNAANSFIKSVKAKLNKEYKGVKAVILGPVPPKVQRVSNSYRDRIIIKCDNTVSFRKMIAETLKEFSTIKEYNKITVYADMNPQTIY